MLLPPADRPISAEIASRIFETEICQATFISPAIFQEMSRNERQLQSLKKLHHILWAGAPFTSADVAEKVKSCVEVHPAYGSSEAGPFPLILEDQSYSDYMHFHPLLGATLRPFSEDYHELVITKDAKFHTAQFVFWNFPELSEWPTKDLFVRHPTKPDLWLFKGRRDDTIVLSNARNVHPGLMEQIVMSNPKVRAALLTGNKHSKTVLLVEAQSPPQTSEEAEQLRKDLWPRWRRRMRLWVSMSG